MLKTIDSKNHFVLWKTGDLKSTIEDKLKNMGFDENKRRVYIEAYDIKNFYTNLSHDEIRKAARWLITEFKKTKRHAKWLGIPKDEIRFRSRTVRENGWTWWNFDMLMKTVDFDLQNAIFLLGDIILKQGKGTPMGSTLSPAIAILVAAYYEWNFLSDLPDEERRLFGGVRYVDDILLFCFVDLASDKYGFKTAEVIDKFVRTCYHSDLLLEPEKIENNKVIFLEAELLLSDKNILVSHKNKNWDRIKNVGKQTIFRFCQMELICSQKY